MMKKYVLSLLFCFLCVLPSFAYDFVVDGIYYNFLVGDSVEVMYRSGDTWADSDRYTGVVTIPETVSYNNVSYRVTTIGNSAFDNCYNLTAVTIPNSVTTIQNYAFSNCTSLTSITIPNSVTTIGWGAFQSCSGLTAITIPASITLLSNYAFASCPNIETMNVEAGNPKYHSAGNCIIETAAQRLVAGCKNSVIPTDGSVTIIGGYAFAACTNLSSITLPEGIITLEYSAFNSCTNLASIVLPSTLTTMENSVFGFCSNLTAITIPSSVTAIGVQAFAYCSNLETLTVESGNSTYHSAGNCIIETATKTLIVGCKNSAIPTDGSVTAIGDEAFYGCSNLTSIVIPNNVTTLGRYSFCNCSNLSSVTIPASVDTIGSYAFCDSYNLQNIRMESTTPPVFEEYAFNNLHSEAVFTVPCGYVDTYRAADGWRDLPYTFVGSFDYAFAVQTNNEAYGTVSIAQAPTCENNGLSVITATAAEHCRFVRWSDGDTNAERTLFVTQDSTLTAEFEAIMFTVLASANDAEWGTVEGAGDYQEGQTATLTATPTTGYYFTAWSDGNTENPRNITVTADTTLVANFSQIIPLTGISFDTTAVSLFVGEVRELIVNFSPADATYQNVTWSSSNAEVVSVENGILTAHNQGTATVIVVTADGAQMATCTVEVVSPKFTADGIYYNYLGGDSVEVTYEGEKYWANYDRYTGSVTIPETVVYNNVFYSVTTIGYRAFDSCSNLTAITIPNSVTTIGYSAFESCSNLTAITIPNSVTTIQNDAFNHCTSLTSITIPNSVTMIEWGAFRYCSGLTAITIPASVTSLSNYAFAYCPNIETMNVEAGNPKYHSAGNCIIETAAQRVVAGCKNSVIPTDGSVTTIGSYAFAGCTNLPSITLPEGIITLEYNAFQSCTNLASIVFLSTLTTMEIGVFLYCSNLTAITIPSSVTAIGGCAFAYCSNLETLTVESGNSTYHSAGNCIIETATKTLIAGCQNSAIPADGSVTTIGDYAFYGCSNLTSIVISDNVTTLGRNSFDSCYNLSSVTIPASVDTIGDRAFVDCYNLQNIRMESTTPPVFEENAFNNLHSEAVFTVPCGYVDTYKAADGWRDLPYTFVGAFDYAFAVQTNNEAYGTVSIAQAPTCENNGLSVITATAAAHCRFVRWSDGNTNAERTIIVTQDSTLTAEFEAIMFTVSAYVNNAAWGTVEGAGKYQEGQTATLTAKPTTGYHFDYWSDGNTENPRNITVTSDTTCVANFSQLVQLTGISLDTTALTLFAGETRELTVHFTPTNATYQNVTWSSSDAEVVSVENGILTAQTEGTATIVVATADGAYMATCAVEVVSPKFTVDGMYYNYLGGDSVEVTYEGESSSYNYDRYTGSVTVPETVSYNNVSYRVTTIGNSAFDNCYNLTAVTIPNSVTTIGWGAFRNCSGLTAIMIPVSVISLRNEVFSFCPNIETMNVEAGNPNYHSAGNCIIETATQRLVAGCKNSVIPTDGSVTIIGEYAFCGCSNLQAITIPTTVTTIQDGAFQYCYSLNDMTLPNNLTTIEQYAFYSCNSLQSITLSNSLTTIEYEAFYDCDSLTAITIPSSVTAIGAQAFAYCSNLETLTVESGNSTYHSAGNCIIETATKTLIVGCKNSAIPADGSVTVIGSYAFMGCSNISSIVIPDNITRIGHQAFQSCHNLISITIPNSVKTLGSDSFRNCSNLSSVTIPASVDTISSYAFCDSYNLQNIRMESTTPPVFEVNAFNNLHSEAVFTVPCGYVDTYKSAAGWSDLPYTFVGAFEYTLTLKRNIDTYGTVTITQAPTCENNGMAVIIATPVSGCTFESWNDGSTDNPRAIMLTQDTTLTANFARMATNSVTYELNGGVTNPWGWTCPQDMYNMLNADWNAYSGTSTVWSPLKEVSKDNIAQGIPTQAATLDVDFLADSTFKSHFQWLIDYMDAKCTEAGVALPSSGGAALRYNLAAFFGNGYRTAWPAGPDYTFVGVGNYEAYQDDWKKAYVNPTEPIETFRLNAPYRAGYTFLGWYDNATFAGEPIITVDTSTSGTLYAKWENTAHPGYYVLTYIVDGVEISSESIAPGTSLANLEEPTKEGYSFSGWSDVPATMPENDITVSGTFTINSYTLMYVVDGEVVSVESVEYGTPLVAREEPTKEGYTFSGWSEIPATMPAQDVTVYGVFSAGKFLLTYLVDGEVYATDSIWSGMPIVPIEGPTKEGYTFSGWGVIPATMPEHDLIVAGMFVAIKVTDVSLDESQLTLFVGETRQLVVTVLPEDALNKDISWESDNNSVATVENGLITAVTRGTAIITALSVETGYQAICLITVRDDTAVEDIDADDVTTVQKVFENGTIYILRNGERYTIDGRKVE